MKDNVRKGVSIKESVILTPKLIRSAPANMISNNINNLLNLLIMMFYYFHDGFTRRCSNPVKFVYIKNIRRFY